MCPAGDRVVKVRHEVYQKLLALQSKLQLSLGRRVSFNEVIERLLASHEGKEPGKLPASDADL